MKCYKCNQEFTQEDKDKANFKSYMGKYSHRMCPGTFCTVCNEEIATYGEAKKTAANLGTGWQHKNCELRISRTESSSEEYNASSWIVK